MIKVFIPEIKGKIKTSVRGFWRNAEGKLYYDYLRVKGFSFDFQEDLINKLNAVKQVYNQECIAYKEGKVLKIYYNKDKIEVLPHRIYKEVLRQDLKVAIKEALRQYSGLTVYNEAGKYFIEAFTTI